MTALRMTLALALAGFTGFALAQDGVRGSTPPGISQDGSTGSQGAIKGGSIQPGETGGVPEKGKALETPSERAVSRCNDLSGTLREQCLKEAAAASTGSTLPPERPIAGPTERDPRASPPPQNPR